MAPNDYDEIHKYLSDLIFKKNSVNFDKKYDARAWITELFMNSQAESKLLNKLSIIVYVSLLSITYSGIG